MSSAFSETTMNVLHLQVQGMRCGGCVKNVTAALKSLPGVRSVEVDLQSGYVTVNSDFNQRGEPLALALTTAGYPAKLFASSQTAMPEKGENKSGACCG